MNYQTANEFNPKLNFQEHVTNVMFNSIGFHVGNFSF